MLTSRLPLTASLACALLTAACANKAPASTVVPPQLQVQPEAAKPCRLPMVGDSATEVDLEIAYGLRGVAIVECNGRRELANQTLTAEHELQARWLEERAERNKPFWKFW